MDAIDFLSRVAELMTPVRIATDHEGRDCWGLEHRSFGYVEGIADDATGVADLVSPLTVPLSDADSLRALLGGCAQGSGSGHGALVIHPVHGPALQTRLALADLDEESFDRMVGAHLLYARMWHEDEGIGMDLTPPADAMGASANEVILHL